MSNSGRLVFGFDLGTNSIGWAVLKENASESPTSIVDVGSRIFNRAVEEKTSTPKNQKRRAARLARRVTQRRARRRRRLENYLISLGLLPPELRQNAKREAVLNSLGDPYTLRARALDKPLSSYELGRTLLHLGMRRGFQSARRTLLSDMEGDPDVEALLAELEQESDEGEGQAEKERQKEEGEFKAAITELNAQIRAAGKRTLGEYLAGLPVTERKRNRRTGRDMIRHELDSILAEQAPHHPVLADAVREEITHIVFFQRPLRWNAETIGSCSLEPRRRRAARGRLEYQRFRILQDLNHLRYDYPEVDKETGKVEGIDLSLSESDRAKLMRRLDAQRSMTWAAIRKELGLAKTVRFNLESGSKEKGLAGNGTACSIRRVIGDAGWEALNPERQHELVEDLFKFEKKSALKTRLMRRWGFDVRKAIELATLELELGYANLSLKAIRRLLPYMEQGMIYSEARKAAGYGYEEPPKEALARLPAPQDLRNPVVNKALHEFRRVCNALIATYGHPDCVRVELPRELTMTRKRKAAFERQQKENQRANEEAAAEYAKVRSVNPHLNLPERPRREDLLKYRLWKEQGYVSSYSRRTISATELFSAAVEVDHILPYSRSLDDSYMNKVVAFAQENRDKGTRTPFEAFSGNGEAWEERIQFVRKLPLPKRNRFLREVLESVDGFINSQLTDTAYISREVASYVRRLGCDVSVSKGILTAWLRHRWGLNTLLGGFEKNRTDHRHHAIDAAVTAAVNRSHMSGMVQAYE